MIKEVKYYYYSINDIGVDNSLVDIKIIKSLIQATFNSKYFSLYKCDIYSTVVDFVDYKAIFHICKIEITILFLQMVISCLWVRFTLKKKKWLWKMFINLEYRNSVRITSLEV